MSISDNYIPINEQGNGVTVDYSANWAMLNAAYFLGYLELISTGVRTPIVVGTDGTLVFDNSGFTFTFNSSPSALYNVIIGRDVTVDQGNPYRTAKGFQGAVIENSFDKLTAICQDLRDGVNRSVQFALGSTDQASLGSINDRGVLYFDNDVIKSDGGSIDDLTAATSAAVAAAATATTQAGISITGANTSTAQATIATTQATLAQAAVAAVANPWSFSTTTTMADPGAGKIRLNNATIASATQIAISINTAATGNPGIKAFIDSWDDSSHSPRGILTLAKNSSNFAIFGISGGSVDGTTWETINVTYISGAGTFAVNDVLEVGFLPAGNDGTGTGNVNGPASAGDNSIALYNGTTGKIIKAGVALGSSGQVLTSNGAGVAPSFQSIASGGQIQKATFVASGTFTTPSTITTSTVFEISQVAGGGGGGSAITAAGAAGGGGGAGGGRVDYVTGLSPSTGYTVTIGAFGAGGSGNGGQTSIIIGANTYATTGGTGGSQGSVTNTAIAGGNGGSVTGAGVTGYQIDGGAGCASVSTALGTNCIGGLGGTSMFGSMGGVATPGGAAYGTGGWGAGGSGASRNTTNTSGGNAMSGFMLIKWIG